ncbi:reverse transcriptase-like protein [Bacillus luteolus]|uniref:Reverse transcriptase-like protein n=1 Tax=Litchfieldia luteola TaxID=682179 RepID=A0ABR9QNT1_9BACI|nr:ribonuclease H family protein [Cytobacillus luteolus]MBE4910173.1 reverse transcriptase-like protein [Cytobacillus luteolus]MBP1942261.1 ribonuclease HI [Cytobacillus luteolus]
MKLWIEWTYKTPRNKVVVLNTELMKAEEALLISDDFEKTGRVKELFFYDEQHTKWTKKEITKLLKEIETEPHDVIAYFDGGFDIGTNKSGLGVAIYYTQNKKKYRVRVNEAFDELDNNNEAEYAAFWFMLQKLEELGVHHLPVTFRGDSHVVLKQLSGEWPCMEENLNRWLDRIEEKIKSLGIIPNYDPITRKENNEADKLATQALQGVIVSSNFELDGK